MKAMFSVSLMALFIFSCIAFSGEKKSAGWGAIDESKLTAAEREELFLKNSVFGKITGIRKDGYLSFVGEKQGHSLRWGRVTDKLFAGKKYLISLYGVEIPVEGQPYGQEVQTLIKLFLIGRNVEIIPVLKDKNIYVCKVRFDGIDFASWLTSNGLAWCTIDLNALPNPADSRYELELMAEFKKAQDAKINIWSDKNPVMPSVFLSNVNKDAPEKPKARGMVIDGEDETTE